MREMETSRDLIRKIKQGNTPAFEELFRIYSAALIRFGWRIVRNTQIAENIVQDVFVRIWHNRATLDPDLNIKAYLYQAVKNQALQHIRHLKIENRQDDMPDVRHPGRSPEARIEEQETASAVYEAVAQLPPHRRIIFTLSKYDHFTYAEIAAIQNISIKTVETQMGRALKFLRQYLSDALLLIGLFLSGYFGI
jgi:RNA polymerase sigma-70 factor (ECF subfamily)